MQRRKSVRSFKSIRPCVTLLCSSASPPPVTPTKPQEPVRVFHGDAEPLEKLSSVSNLRQSAADKYVVVFKVLLDAHNTESGEINCG